MISDLIRDTVFGHVVRKITKNRALQFAEERDPSLWKQYLDRDQTRNMALYGHPQLTEEEKKEKDISEGSPAESDADLHTPTEQERNALAQTQTQRTTHEHQMHSTLTNQRVDTEKGRDLSMVSWWGDNDPEVSFQVHIALPRPAADE